MTLPFPGVILRGRVTDVKHNAGQMADKQTGEMKPWANTTCRVGHVPVTVPGKFEAPDEGAYVEIPVDVDLKEGFSMLRPFRIVFRAEEEVTVLASADEQDAERQLRSVESVPNPRTEVEDQGEVVAAAKRPARAKQPA